ncbi:hypothetical protein TRFO_39788 [Tritrichomonas foetus]|uniref:BAR domain-containing protein n=1 Tax=Tritrichomonas foetus TaxID=1144522 RepID=A0A1J4J9W6_9EUKA|nr:hypothetical protein TRFO_39788 [Tritrichomonas foetus]|eukprot:OHS94044.1 hypothetical protein TRFO_39788 [Tritrichomonas foetus]
MTFLFKAPKTVDEEYKDAKNKLKTYMITSQNIVKSIQKLGAQLTTISKSYSNMAGTVYSWFKPEATPSIQQSNQSLAKAAIDYDNLSNQFVSQINPNFGAALNEYDEHVNILVELEKKRRIACNNFDKARERLRAAQTAKEPNQDRIQQAQAQVDETQGTYEQANTEYIDAVKQFGEERKTKLLEAFKILAATMCQYINQTASIQTIPFPVDGQTERPRQNEIAKVDFSQKKEAPTKEKNSDDDLERCESIPTPNSNIPQSALNDHLYSSLGATNEVPSYSMAAADQPKYNEPSYASAAKEEIKLDKGYGSGASKSPFDDDDNAGGGNPFDGGDDDDDDNYDGGNPFA